jgi:hypothetical protein
MYHITHRVAAVLLQYPLCRMYCMPPFSPTPLLPVLLQDA